MARRQSPPNGEESRYFGGFKDSGFGAEPTSVATVNLSNTYRVVSATMLPDAAKPSAAWTGHTCSM
jgi:hypothetical protein